MKATKTSLIKGHLISKGSITSWEAITLYRATRLSAIIFNLKDRGMDIRSIREIDNGVSFARYKLINN